MFVWWLRICRNFIPTPKNCIFLVLCMVILIIMNMFALNKFLEHKNLNTVSTIPPVLKNEHVVWIVGMEKKSTHLKHVNNVFKSFDVSTLKHDFSDHFDENWDIMWSHDYPFFKMREEVKGLKKNHCINHFPCSGYITNKVYLATSGLDFVPKAFQIPKEKEKFLKYAKSYANKMFVQKSNDHRGIKIESLEKLDLETSGLFVQEFVNNPLLIDGYKFDIGVYTVITSVRPLRVYIHEGDMLFRFCSEKYLPFSADILEKYVVKGNYRPIWKVPSLQDYYVTHGLGMKGSFDAWLQSVGKNSEKVWEDIRDAIRSIFYAYEDHLARCVQNYPNHLVFFEMMRFDFILDDDLKVYLMEANMSPNLSSEHFKENRLLYEQVIYNLLSLVGMPYKYCRHQPTSNLEMEMRVATKDITVFPEHCKNNCHNRQKQCTKVECQLCRPCLTYSDEKNLKKSYLEHNWKGTFRRIIPKPLISEEAIKPRDMTNHTPEDTLMTEWFRGKCLIDKSFC